MTGLFKTLLIFLLLANANVLAQCPPNIGFETGDFSNWQCYAGVILPDGETQLTLTNLIHERLTIMDANSGVDPYGHFPLLCPNGSKYSIRIGNDQTGAQAESATYTFTVPPGNAYNLILNYAVVLQNPNHLDYQQPKFTVQVFDVTDSKQVDCPAFNFVASSTLPGFKLSSQIAGGAQVPAFVFYKEWSATSINLTGYAGKTVRLEFTTNDCTLGGHFGYAYIDINEDCGSAISGNTYCSGQPAVNLNAPNGFASYTWYNAADLTHPIGQGETLTINPAPPDQTKYVLTTVPYAGVGCPDTLYTTINKINNAFQLKLVDTVYGCPGTGADLTAAAVTAGSTPGITLSYHTDPVTLDYLYAPKAVTQSGTYYIRGISPEGCINILPIQVAIVDPTLTINDPDPVRYPATVDISKTHISRSGETYSYYADSTASTPLLNYKTINTSGTYYIKAISKYGCSIIEPVNVQVGPPLPYKVTAPNVFTPNNDGINDHFMVTLDGFVSFSQVKIFNRYGQLLFTAKSPGEYWDGTFNGQPVPAGTYYWVFDGMDEYYHTKAIKSGSISVIR